MFSYSIIDSEFDYQQRDKINGEYAIGTYCIINGIHIVGSTISNRSFFKLRFNKLVKYLHNLSYYYRAHFYSRVEILQIQIDPVLNTYYNPIIKTFWLRLIQRHWKKIFHIRNEKIFQLKKIEFLKRREIGKAFIRFPRLKGMLSMYSHTA
jgi:hypothetical protein